MILTTHAAKSAFLVNDAELNWESRGYSSELLSEENDDFADVMIWDDCHLADLAKEELEDRDALLNQLLHMTLSSLSSYQEIVDLATNNHLQSFAEVMVRQRSAQYLDLQHHLEHIEIDPAEHDDALSELRCAWRLAVWNLEQDRHATFAQHAERAESLLEEAFLTAANAIHDAEWEHMLTDFAVMVCGARSVWEDLANDMTPEFGSND